VIPQVCRLQAGRVGDNLTLDLSGTELWQL
jgi:hypothetical protein